MKQQPHRRLLSLLFLTAAMLSAVPALAADVTFTIGLLTYTGYDSSDALVSKCDKNAVGELIIPESVEYKGVHYSVASIGSLAFQDCSSLTSVTIPNSVTYIGSNAFNGCSGLTSMEIPNSVTNIDHAAFRNCNGLTSIEIPNSVTNIDHAAFRNCNGLTSIEIPNSVTSIGGSAFQGCSSLASVTIPNSVTSIGDYVFRDCNSLTSVTIPNSVTSIGEQAFRECSSLTNIQVESGNTNYCSVDGVLFNSDESELVIFPAGKAGEYKILTSVTHICDYAFWGCSNLSSVYIPSSVRSIGRRAFPGCSSLTNIQVESGNTNYCSSDGILFNSDKSELVIFPAGRTGEYQIPNSVTKICDYAFYGRSSLTSAEIPSSVTYIGNSAFQDCSDLTSMEIPSSVTYIGDGAFQDCSSLTSVEIPSSVTNLGESAFENCSSLTTVEIPNSVTNLGESAFENCSSLTTVEIPNSVKHIGYHTFAGCSSLTSVKIPTSVTSIGFQVIYGCSSLTMLIIPSPVTDIQSGAFMGCENLKSIYLFGKCSHNLGVESVYTFYDNGYHFDNAVYLVGEISTTQTTAEFDVQIVGEVDSFDFEYADATGVTVKETANQSGRVSLLNLRADSTTALKITVHMANGEAYDYNSEITTKDADEHGAIEVVETVEEAAGIDVYNLSGECVRRNAGDLSGLRPGIYIANGRKFIVR